MESTFAKVFGHFLLGHFYDFLYGNPAFEPSPVFDENDQQGAPQKGPRTLRVRQSVFLNNFFKNESAKKRDFEPFRGSPWSFSGVPHRFASHSNGQKPNRCVLGPFPATKIVQTNRLFGEEKFKNLQNKHISVLAPRHFEKLTKFGQKNTKIRKKIPKSTNFVSGGISIQKVDDF